jgi:amino acid transporter
MISKKHLVLRTVLSGVLTLIIGVAVALCFPKFSGNDLTLFGSFILYIGELVVVHVILWMCFRKRKKYKEPFLCKNIVISEGIGAAAFVFLTGVICNNDYNLLFLTIVGILWAFVAVIWNVFEDQGKKNQEIKTAQEQKNQQPKTNKGNNKSNNSSNKKRK